MVEISASDDNDSRADIRAITVDAPRPILRPLGDQVVLMEFSNAMDERIIKLQNRWEATLRQSPPDGMIEIVRGMTNLSIFYDPILTDSTRMSAWLETLAPASCGAARAVRMVEIPVLYGGVSGPDLEDSAARVGIAPREFVARHLAATFDVRMLGFSPGFPYLSGLPADLALPRWEKPRLRVAAGSVAVAGAQCCIYPQASPGGWRVIGRTPLRLFHADRDPPTLLAPGDRVRFREIDQDEFDRLAAEQT